ncbi:toll-like receptor 2 [Ambystoma mexicanum]|uniref:toll-like receptor 2 n=1 Tax=Ambystoma mexicanum TaxID=8296 RepID=UPI0037E9C767
MTMPSLTWICILPAIITATLSEGRSCSSLCMSGRFCGCSSRGLKDFPSGLPKGVEELDLSNNIITHVKGSDLKDYVHLRMLLLQLNDIVTIENDTFNSNINLEHLDLSYNSLSTLQLSWIRPLLSLKFLNLLGNYYTTLGTTPLFTHLPHLQFLKFGNPYFLSVDNHTLEGIRELQVLELDATNLRYYHRGSFSSVREIAHMTVSVKQESLYGVLQDIANSVTWLEIANADFQSQESLAGMDVLTHSVVKKLTFRNASMTDKSLFTFIEIMENYINMLQLDVEDSTLYGTGKVPHVKASGTGSITVVTIRNLLIPDFFLFSDLSFVYDLVANVTSVTCVGSKVFLVPCRFAQSFKSLQYLDLSRNLLIDQMLEFSTCHMEGGGAWPLLGTLNLSRNFLKHLGAVAVSLSDHKHLTNLDISQNNFLRQMPVSCQWPKALQYLNLSSCQITKLTSCIPVTLEVLDVSNNALNEFVVRLPDLKELYIAKNKLVTLPYADHLPNLIMLVISTNSLHGFSKEDLEPFKNLKALDGRYNNYICSCEFLAFIHSPKGLSDMLIGWPVDYACDSPSSLRGKQVNDAHLPVIVCYQTFIVLLICTVVLLLLVFIVVLCYKYHTIWYAKMIWAWLKAKRGPTKRFKEDICYDAFVSYSERDSEWVENLMAQELENANPPLKLCLHKRDFVPGKWIIDNIIDSMEKSHKTLFVLSEYFVQSEWCKYELEFSHFRLFDENNDATILILLEAIEKETIPKRFCKLRKLMNTKTYLEWPLDEEQQHMFWFNLRAALKTEDFPPVSQLHPLV